MADRWQERDRPSRLEGRYEFDSYSELRDFLERAAALSEKADYYPNMGFGNNYVNVTIYAEEGADTLTEQQRSYAKALDELLTTAPKGT